MIRVRMIPCLLLRGTGFVKTRGFKDPVYLGDCLNIVRIFNDKEADELAILDITATPQGRSPNYDLVSDLASQCFMPLAYGGGIRHMEDIRRLFKAGIEKVCINSHAFYDRNLISTAARECGSQSIVVSIDVRRRWLGKYEVMVKGGQQGTSMDPVVWSKQVEQMGAGEILLTSIDRDGTREGYDIDLINRVATSVNIPVVACGGAGSVADCAKAIKMGGASAVAAGSLFVFHGPHRAVLINMPAAREFDAALEACGGNTLRGQG